MPCRRADRGHAVACLRIVVSVFEQRSDGPEHRCSPAARSLLAPRLEEARERSREFGSRIRWRLGNELGPAGQCVGLGRSDGVEECLGPRRPDVTVQAKDPVPGDLVVGVVEQAGGRDEVLHVSGFEESKAAVLPVRDLSHRKLYLDKVAVMPGAHEHGLLAKLDPRS